MQDRNYLLAQKRRRDVALFKPYMHGEQGVAFRLPANATLAVKAEGLVTVTAVALLVNDVELSVPPMAAGDIHRYDHVECGHIVQSTPGFILLLDAGLGKYVPIGKPS